MTSQELFEQGKLAEAIQAQNAQVKSKPTDLDARHQLSVLLAFAGDLDRAFLQLDTLGRQDSELAMASNLYRGLLSAEQDRRTVLHEEGQPLLPPDCPAHIELRLEALGHLHKGDVAAASAALDRANEQAPNLAGKLNGEEFRGIRDYDDLLGPVLELYAGGKYLWMPYERIASLEISKPVHQLDLLWVPAKLVDTFGDEANVHVPVLYEGSHAAEDGRLQTGRLTDWIDAGEIGYRGVGQRVILSAQGEETRETGLLEIRSLELASAQPGEGSLG